MQGAKFLGGLRRLTANESFAVAVLAAVTATAALAFGLGAGAEITGSMLLMGAATAIAETRLRSRG